MDHQIVTDKTGYKIQPKDIDTEAEHFWGAFDNLKTEVSAKWIVRLCQTIGGWYPFTYEEINAFYTSFGHQRQFSFNRLVNYGTVNDSRGRRPVGGGWIIKGNDEKYRVTDDFIIRCFRSAQANLKVEV